MKEYIFAHYWPEVWWEKYIIDILFYKSALIKLSENSAVHGVFGLAAKFNKTNLHPLVPCNRDPQLQVVEDFSYLFSLKSNICKSWYLSPHLILNNSDLIGE